MYLNGLGYLQVRGGTNCPKGYQKIPDGLGTNFVLASEKIYNCIPPEPKTVVQAPQPSAPPPSYNFSPQIQVSPSIQTNVSPQISPVFQQSYMPQNSPMSAGTTQTVSAPQSSSPSQTSEPASPPAIINPYENSPPQQSGSANSDLVSLFKEALTSAQQPVSPGIVTVESPASSGEQLLQPVQPNGQASQGQEESIEKYLPYLIAGGAVLIIGAIYIGKKGK